MNRWSKVKEMKIIRNSLALCLMIAIFTLHIAAGEATAMSMKIEWKAEEVHTDSLFMENDRLYAPVRFMSEHLDAQVTWDAETNQAEIRSSDGHVIFISAHSAEVERNGTSFWSDAAPIIRNDRLHLPVRLMVELLHMNVSLDADRSTVTIESVPLYEVQESDTVETIANDLKVDAELLRVYNGIHDGDDLTVGDQLAVVFSQLLQENEWTEEDIQLLAKIIQVEAGHESDKGKIAVGNVVMNRVESDQFPDTIEEVIYQPGQFPPALNGKLDNLEPSESSKEAAVKVLSGERIANHALYFYNPNVSKSVFFTSRKLDVEVGNHRFVE